MKQNSREVQSHRFLKEEDAKLTRLFELLVGLLGINGVPGVVDDEQEVGNAPAVHPAGSDGANTNTEYSHHAAEFIIISAGFYTSFAL